MTLIVPRTACCVLTDILKPPDRIGHVGVMLPPMACTVRGGQFYPVANDVSRVHTGREPESPVKVWYAPSLPFSDPVGAVEP